MIRKFNIYSCIYMLLMLYSTGISTRAAALYLILTPFTLTWEGEKRRRDRKVSQFRPNREWHYCQLATLHDSVRWSCLCWCLFSKLSKRGDKSCAAVCGDQPAISVHHLGTVCPLGSFLRSQRVDNGRGRGVLLWAGNVSGGQQRKQV